MSNKTILVYSPNLTGHPQVYCRVIGDILLKAGVNIMIATENIRDIAIKWPDLESFTKNNNVKLLSTKELSGRNEAHLNADEMRVLQEQNNVFTTLFIEPEYFHDEFIKIGLGHTKRLYGRNVGIFARTTNWYPGEDFYSGKKIGVFDGSLRQILGAAVRKYTKPWTVDKYFYEQILINKRVLDVVIVKDERVADKFPQKVRWLPEIYKVFDDSPIEEDSEYSAHVTKIVDFVQKVDPKNLVLYYGAGAWYKGYDYFLEFMARNKEAVAIHAGSGLIQKKGREFVGTPEKTRERLLSEGRLYETGQYVASRKLIDFVFHSARRFLSTHRLTVSSGTMLQALDYGQPVLMPDTGLVGYRTRQNRLGETYRYGDIDDMVRKWNDFKEQPVERYESAIKKFMTRFGRRQVEDLFVDVLVDV